MADTINWGDGRTSPVELRNGKWSGSHHYTTPGAFEVTLSDSKGKKLATKSFTAKAKPAPKPDPVTPTGVTAGKPGALTPTGATVPATLPALEALRLAPGAAWAEGTYVTLGDASEAYWGGTGWGRGKAPAPKAPDPVKATAATAGAPGTFTPPGAVPADAATLAALNLTPGAAWTEGQYVELADRSKQFWNGTMWAMGVAPAPKAADPVKATDVSRGTPGTWEPSNAAPPAGLAALTALALTPGTAWTSGQFVTLGDASEAHWSGTAWAAGKAP